MRPLYPIPPFYSTSVYKCTRYDTRGYIRRVHVILSIFFWFPTALLKQLCAGENDLGSVYHDASSSTSLRKIASTGGLGIESKDVVPDRPRIFSPYPSLMCTTVYIVSSSSPDLAGMEDGGSARPMAVTCLWLAYYKRWWWWCVYIYIYRWRQSHYIYHT